MHALNHHIAKDGFRLRGTEMSRLDAFSDVVFGFALTLIVVSLEVPKTYRELHALLLGFGPFAICFLFLMMVWWAHFRFFRRYGLHDFATMVINACVLFLLLFYVYPLKFLFTIFFRSMTPGGLGGEVFQSWYEAREMMAVYSIGFAAVYFAITALYINAWRLRDDLNLSIMERTLTKAYIWDFFGVGFVGILALIVTFLLPVDHAPAAGFTFFAVGIYKTIHGTIAGRHIRKAADLTPAEHKLPLPPSH
jgi:uncharacterized membrane protein